MGEGVPGPRLARLQLIDEVDQLAEATEGAVIERKDQSGQIRELVELLRHRSGLEPRQASEDVGELVLQLGEVARMDGPHEAEGQVVADDPRRVIHPVEARHLADGLVGRIDDPKQRRVLGIDEPTLHQGARDPPVPDAPVRLGSGLDQYHRHQPRLTGLHEGEELEGLVHRAEAAGKERHTACFLDEEELAGEEILEGDQLGVGSDPRVRLLLERQADVQAEALLAARPFLGRTHDARARTGDDHPALLGHSLAEEACAGDSFLARGRARRAEDRHLADASVGREDLVGVAQLLERRVRDLEVARPGTVLVQLQRSRQELLEVSTALGRDFLGVEQVGDQAIGGVLLELITARLGHRLRVYRYPAPGPNATTRPVTTRAPPRTVKAETGSPSSTVPRSAPTIGWTLRKIAARGAGTRARAQFQTT